jgi:hypothetical protein
VSIIPRGIGALGYTLQTPLEDRFLMSRSELMGKIKGLLGGRAAEETGLRRSLHRCRQRSGEGGRHCPQHAHGLRDERANAQPVAGGKGLIQSLSGPGAIHAAPVGNPGDADRQETQDIIDAAYQSARQILTSTAASWSHGQAAAGKRENRRKGHSAYPGAGLATEKATQDKKAPMAAAR